MDGCQATEKIIAYLKDVEVTVPKVVGISGHIEEKYINKAIEAGMATVVGKPARIQDLKHAIKDLHWSSWARLNNIINIFLNLKLLSLKIIIFQNI